jgi:NAD(P)-dependent dehydrogenase (short-subunit alcohol dehydrogenase family)
MNLENSVCLVTGAARRVGRAISLEFARRGARVAVHYRSSREDAFATAEECARLSGGREALTVAADQTDPEAIERAVVEVLDRTGRIDILVNSASIFHSTPFLKMTREQWDAMLDTNLRGPAWFCRAVAPGMIERGEGVIINIADVCGERPWPRYIPYCAAKAALINLTRGLAMELAPAVRVNAIGPGTVLLPDGASESLQRRAERASLLGRMGAPEDIAKACVFLVEGSDYITGAFLPVDGGKSLLGRHESDLRPEKPKDKD